MNLRKSVLSFMAAFAVIAGGFAGVAAQDIGDSVDMTINVTSDGEFDVQFCAATSDEVAAGGDVTFDPVTLDSENPTEDVSETVVICYTDTLPYRAAFTAHLSADDFKGETEGNVISNDNLTLGKLSIMNSGQWGHTHGDVFSVGSIAAKTGRTSAPTSITSHTGAPWEGPDFSNTGGLFVHDGHPGKGTAGTKYMIPHPGDTHEPYPQDARSTNGSWQELELVLTVPSDTQTDIYTSELTIDVTWDAPAPAVPD